MTQLREIDTSSIDACLYTAFPKESEKEARALQKEAIIHFLSHPSSDFVRCLKWKGQFLPRTLELFDNKVCMPWNKLSLGDELVGRGSLKKVKGAFLFEKDFLIRIRTVARATICRNADPAEQKICDDCLKNEAAVLTCLARLPNSRHKPFLGQGVFLSKKHEHKGLLKTVVYSELYESNLYGVLGTFRNSERIEITKQLLEGLAEMHEAGFAHRDIASDNIFGNRAPLFWVIQDVEFACMPSKIPLHETLLMGDRIAYYPPEVVQAQKGSPPWRICASLLFEIDLWMMAIVLHTLWAGREPWWACIDDTPTSETIRLMRSLTQARVFESLRQDSSLPPPVKELLFAMFQFDPEKRPPAAILKKNWIDLIEIKRDRSDFDEEKDL